jgi:protein-disulfide isomerase
MKARLLPFLCLLGFACGGTQTTVEPSAPTDTPPANENDQQRIERLEKALQNNTEALQRLEQEQAETLQLFQLVATQLAAVQEKLEVLAAAPPAAPTAPTRPRRPRPNPASTYSIPIADSPSVGSRRPLVTIIKAFEFACPFCERVRPTLDQLQKDYRGELRIVYKHFIVHPQTATEAALAACAAGKQGKWKAMEKLLWEKAFQPRDFKAAHIEKLASQAGLRMSRFRADRNGSCKELVRRDQAELSKVGTTGTPSFYINGRHLSGARPIDQFKTLIDEEMAKAKKRIRQDRTLNRGNYYEREILNKGLTELEPAP